VRQLSSMTIKLPGYTGGTGANAAVVAYLQGRNDPVSMPTAAANGSGSRVPRGVSCLEVPAPAGSLNCIAEGGRGGCVGPNCITESGVGRFRG
jgi:hypothetical protein